MMTVLLLLAIGVVMIYSSSGVYALQVLGDSMYFLKRQLMFLLIGIGMTLFVMSVDYRHIQPLAKPILLIAVGLLVLVLVPGLGKEISGAQRWFRLGPINFQPAEFAKLAVIIYVADFLTRKQKYITNFKKGFLPLILVMGFVCAFIVVQPDLGTTVSIAVIILIMMYVAGARISHLTFIGLAAVPVLVFLIATAPYRLKRIIAFLDPWQDPQGIGFQLTQAQIAFGSGGLFGVGLGKSQQKLFYLPAAHTDFILSIIGEEFGLVGCLVIVLLFTMFLWLGVQIVKRIADPFGYFLSIGVLVMIGLQAVVNIGVSIGALPTKGLPLPFISYGGSALIFHLISIGLLLNVSRTQDL